MIIDKYQCPKCGNLFSNIDYEKSHLCPFCRISLTPQLPPKYWLFQFNPKIYNWFGWVRENKGTEQWLITRYSKFICTGDMVVLWSSGQMSGVCGLGSIIAYPAKRALDPEQAKYYLDKDEPFQFLKKPSIVLKYSKIIDEQPLLQDKCRKDDVLSTMNILANHEGTNFSLRKEHFFARRERNGEAFTIVLTV